MSFIGEQFVRTALYLGVQRGDRVVPGGTAFVVSEPIGDGDTAREYLVTARHVLEECRTDDVFILANTTGGGREELRTDRADWLPSRDADVAVLPVPRWLEQRGWDVQPVLAELFIGPGQEYVPHAAFGDRQVAGGHAVQVGDEVFFTGLFVQSAGAVRNVPVARFGRIARMPGEPLRLRRFGGGEVFEARGYLMEATSMGGFSGSPAFWRRPAMRSLFSGSAQIGVEQTYVVALLGVVNAHFETRVAAETGTGDEEARLEFLANSGLAVITPAGEIAALCRREDVVRRHDELAAEAPTAARRPRRDRSSHEAE